MSVMTLQVHWLQNVRLLAIRLHPEFWETSATAELSEMCHLAGFHYQIVQQGAWGETLVCVHGKD